MASCVRVDVDASKGGDIGVGAVYIDGAVDVRAGSVIDAVVIYDIELPTIVVIYAIELITTNTVLLMVALRWREGSSPWWFGR